MLGRTLAVALIAGIVAGILISFVHLGTTIPLIMEAESFEGSSPSSDGHAHAHDTAADGHSHSHDGDSWAPADGLERFIYTLLSNVVAGAGFSLLLAAAIVMRGRAVDVKAGVLWGLAGFAAFSLFPSIGLPPELPGTDGGPVEVRQVWWILTATASAGGIALMVYGTPVAIKGIGLVLILLPHVIGAPHPDVPNGLAPASLAAEFTMLTIVSSAVFWVLIGGLNGWISTCFNRPA
jgi:cobalt transporter subunit CbtA